MSPGSPHRFTNQNPRLPPKILSPAKGLGISIAKAGQRMATQCRYHILPALNRTPCQHHLAQELIQFLQKDAPRRGVTNHLSSKKIEQSRRPVGSQSLGCGFCPLHHRLEDNLPPSGK